jgi:hypothetical protein
MMEEDNHPNESVGESTTCDDGSSRCNSSQQEQKNESIPSFPLNKASTNESSMDIGGIINNGYVADNSSSNSRNEESSCDNKNEEDPQQQQQQVSDQVLQSVRPPPPPPPCDLKLGWVIDVTKQQRVRSSRRRRRHHRGQYRSHRHAENRHRKGSSSVDEIDDDDDNDGHHHACQSHHNRTNSSIYNTNSSSRTSTSTRFGCALLPIASFSLSKLAPSPIHPDIDISLTKHVVLTSPFLVGNDILGATHTTTTLSTMTGAADNGDDDDRETTTIATTIQQPRSRVVGTKGLCSSSSTCGLVSTVNSMDVLSHFVLNYFGPSKKATTPVTVPTPPCAVLSSTTPTLRTTTTTTTTMSDTNVESAIATMGADYNRILRTDYPSRKRKYRTTSKSMSKHQKQSPPPLLPTTSSSSSKNDDDDNNNKTSMPQVISDVASFSSYQYTLEDALDLTDTPRYVNPKLGVSRTVYPVLTIDYSRSLFLSISTIQL